MVCCARSCPRARVLSPVSQTELNDVVSLLNGRLAQQKPCSIDLRSCRKMAYALRLAISSGAAERRFGVPPAFEREPGSRALVEWRTAHS